MNTEQYNGDLVSSELPRDKGGCRKVTVLIPPDHYERLISESAKRKIAGEPDYQLSCILRTAITRYFDKIGVKGS
jgi:hypothetical protein